MRLIVGATFWMGSNEPYPPEGPARRVAADDVGIDDARNESRSRASPVTSEFRRMRML
jgi:hypothetical protein